MGLKNENLKIVVAMGKFGELYLSMYKICILNVTDVHIFTRIQKLGCLSSKCTMII